MCVWCVCVCVYKTGSIKLSIFFAKCKFNVFDKVRIECTICVSLDCIENVFQRVCVLNSGSRALFIGPISTKFVKIFIKIGYHNTIHTFKNYFAIVFSVFNNKRYSNRPYMSTCVNKRKT